MKKNLWKKLLNQFSAIKQGNFEMDTMIGAQASTEQMEKISSYLKTWQRFLMFLHSGNKSYDGLANGYYIEKLYSKEITK